MKYWYNTDDTSGIIRNYIIYDKVVIIYYINGQMSITKLQENTEQEILNKMVEQAIMRDENMSIEVLRHDSLISDIKLLSNITLGMIGVIVSNMENMNYNNQLVGAVLALMTGATCLFEEKHNNRIGNQIEELEKYKLYLNMRKDLEANFNEQTFKGIKLFDGRFDINTLDCYSLNEVKKIKKNLDNNK